MNARAPVSARRFPRMRRFSAGSRALALAAALAALLAACSPRANPADSPLPTFAGATRTASPAATPPRATEEPSEALLAELRASDAFVEFAEAERAKTAPHADGAYGNLHYFLVDLSQPEGTFVAAPRYANREALWPELITPVRDEMLLARLPEYRGVVWDIEEVFPLIQAAWASERTNGRGEVGYLNVPYIDAANRPVFRVWGYAITVDKQTGIGQLIDVSDPFDVNPYDYTTFEEFNLEVANRVLDWALTLPPAAP